jgi:hypothetical protein
MDLMSRIIIKRTRKKRVDHIHANYPYSEWLDGQIRVLEQGVDFHCAPEQLRAHLYVEFPGQFSCHIEGDNLEVVSRV